jgi:hypothetical protein
VLLFNMACSFPRGGKLKCENVNVRGNYALHIFIRKSIFFSIKCRFIDLEGIEVQRKMAIHASKRATREETGAVGQGSIV